MLQLKIVSPEKVEYDGKAESVTVPGALGNFEILTNHAPIISSLIDGVVEYVTEKGEKFHLASTSAPTTHSPSSKDTTRRSSPPPSTPRRARCSSPATTAATSTSGASSLSLSVLSRSHDSPLYTVNHAHSRSIRDICFQPEGIGMVTMGYVRGDCVT